MHRRDVRKCSSSFRFFLSCFSRWQQGLLLAGALGLITLSILSFLNVIRLVNANCPDFAGSAIVSFIVSWILTGLVLRNVFLYKADVLQQDKNVFESIGLLHQESETEDVEEDNEEQLRTRTPRTAAPVEEL
jgi:uncharacterized protein YacL